jgi:predicted nuclease of restriction endonuclease-like RecB superfamily
LYGDVTELHRLESFPGYDSAEALLTRYNEAQLQAVLYNATEMRITARHDYKAIIRAAKLSGQRQLEIPFSDN